MQTRSGYNHLLEARRRALTCAKNACETADEAERLIDESNMWARAARRYSKIADKLEEKK